jgi:hypothetical protein
MKSVGFTELMDNAKKLKEKRDKEENQEEDK